MDKKEMDKVLELAVSISALRLKMIGDFYLPYLAWGLYIFVSGILQLFGIFWGWIILWIPAAFAGSLKADFSNLRESIISWIISGIIYYVMVFTLGWTGFFVGIAVCSTLGYGLLPVLVSGQRKNGSNFFLESIGFSFFVVVATFISLIFLYQTWKKPQLIGYHFAIMVGVFYGIEYAFLRVGLLFFWMITLLLSAPILYLINAPWYGILLLLSVSALSVGIYGLTLKKHVKGGEL